MHGPLDQIVGTALLVGLVLAIGETKNPIVPAYLQPLCVALAAFVAGGTG